MPMLQLIKGNLTYGYLFVLFYGQLIVLSKVGKWGSWWFSPIGNLVITKTLLKFYHFQGKYLQVLTKFKHMYLEGQNLEITK